MYSGVLSSILIGVLLLSRLEMAEAEVDVMED